MLRDDMFKLLNSMIKSAVEEKENLKDVQTKLNTYVDFIDANKLAQSTDIEAFKIVSSNLPEFLSFYSELLDRGVGIEIFAQKNENKKIGFK